MRQLLTHAALLVLPATLAVAQPSTKGAAELSNNSAAANAAATEEEILPVGGDIGLSIDANPFLEYTGKLLSNAGSTAPTWNYLTQNQTITGKYFLSQGFALRGSFRLGVQNQSATVIVANRGVTPNRFPVLPATVENSFSATNTNFGLAGGVEVRRGYGRLQGFFGGELGIAVTHFGAEYKYGNPLTAPDNNASAAINVDPADKFEGQENLTKDPFGGDGRIRNITSGPGFGIGLRGFIGAEYFILPKLSIGGEFGWGFAYITEGNRTVKMETKGKIEVDGNQKDAVANNLEIPQKGKSSVGVDSDSLASVFGPAGRIRMTFHF